jgi:hypothetical protein
MYTDHYNTSLPENVALRAFGAEMQELSCLTRSFVINTCHQMWLGFSHKMLRWTGYVACMGRLHGCSRKLLTILKASEGGLCSVEVFCSLPTCQLFSLSSSSVQCLYDHASHDTRQSCPSRRVSVVLYDTGHV